MSFAAAFMRAHPLLCGARGHAQLHSDASTPHSARSNSCGMARRAQIRREMEAQGELRDEAAAFAEPPSSACSEAMLANPLPSSAELAPESKAMRQDRRKSNNQAVAFSLCGQF